jgi:membrane protein
MVTREIKCRYCQGYGFIRADKNCPVCGGTGKVTQTDLEIGKKLPDAAQGLFETILIIFEKPIIFFIPGLILYAICKYQLELQPGYINGAFIVGSFLHVFNIFSKDFGKIHKVLIAVSIILFAILFIDTLKSQDPNVDILYILGFFFVNFISFYKSYYKFVCGVLLCAVVFFFLKYFFS